MGNELGHLVAMSPCIDAQQRSSGSAPALTVQKGGTLSLESWYYAGSNDTRLVLGSRGYVDADASIDTHVHIIRQCIPRTHTAVLGRHAYESDGIHVHGDRGRAMNDYTTLYWSGQRVKV